jgi:hypothetical protein
MKNWILVSMAETENYLSSHGQTTHYNSVIISPKCSFCYFCTAFPMAGISSEHLFCSSCWEGNFDFKICGSVLACMYTHYTHTGDIHYMHYTTLHAPVGFSHPLQAFVVHLQLLSCSEDAQYTWGSLISTVHMDSHKWLDLCPTLTQRLQSTQNKEETL